VPVHAGHLARDGRRGRPARRPADADLRRLRAAGGVDVRSARDDPFGRALRARPTRVRQPTITDIDAILGYLNPSYFLGGRAQLDVPKARRLFEEKVADPGSDRSGELQEVPGYDFEQLRPGNAGPAIVWTPITTLAIPPGQAARLDEHRNPVLSVGG
jgi:N-methylhydantoinase A/oxoprolinase/acetone carboxylase beta subunit